MRRKPLVYQPSPIGAECIDCRCDMIRHRDGDTVQCWRCGRWYLLARAFPSSFRKDRP